MRSQKPLSGVDTAWLRMDDPTNLMTITSVLVLDDPMDIDTLKEVVEERMLGFPRFRQRVSDIDGNPHWELDPHFDIDQHVRRSALPPPAGQEELQERVSDLMSVPFDFSKPLWHMEFIEDYRGGSALIVRLHHCIADGIALVQVLLSLTDEFFDPNRLPAPSPSTSSGSLVPSVLRPPIDAATSAIDTVTSASSAALREGLTMALRPKHLFKRVKQGMSLGAALTKLALLEEDTNPLLKGDLSVAQRAVWSPAIDLTTVKAIGKTLGAKVNDVLLGAVAGAVRQYFLHRDHSPDGAKVRAVIPVNLRPLESAFELGNRFGLVFLLLPVDIHRRPERVISVKRQMDDIKGSSEAVAALGLLELIGNAPGAVEDQFVQLFSSKASLVMTNVPGPQETLHLRGRTLQHIMPWVPRAGKIGLGVSVFSYDGEVRLGIACDANLIPDPEIMIDGFLREFEALEAAYAPSD